MKLQICPYYARLAHSALCHDVTMMLGPALQGNFSVKPLQLPSAIPLCARSVWQSFYKF